MAVRLHMNMTREEYKIWFAGIRDHKREVYRFAGQELKMLSCMVNENEPNIGLNKQYIYYKFLRKITHHTCKGHKAFGLPLGGVKSVVFDTGGLSAKINITDEETISAT